MSKKDTNYEKVLERLVEYSQEFTGQGFNSFFNNLFEQQVEKYPYERLGNGYELRPIKLTAKEKEDSHIINSNYCNLYHNGLKVSDNIFRKGGIGGNFKDGYCQLIHYIRERKSDKYGKRYFSSGEHVIVNNVGEIVLKSDSFSSNYPAHDGGNVGHIKDLYYDLRTGKPFMVKGSSDIIGSKKIIVNHSYDWYGKELNIPIGIYIIDKQSCEFEKIDEVK